MISFDLTIKKRKCQIMNCKIFAQLDCDRVISGYLTCRATVRHPLTSCKARHAVLDLNSVRHPAVFLGPLLNVQCMDLFRWVGS